MERNEKNANQLIVELNRLSETTDQINRFGYNGKYDS